MIVAVIQTQIYMQTRLLTLSIAFYAASLAILLSAAIAINGTGESSFAMVFGMPAVVGMLQLNGSGSDQPWLATRITAVVLMTLLSCVGFLVNWMAPEYLATPWQGPVWTSAAGVVIVPVLCAFDPFVRQ